MTARADGPTPDQAIALARQLVDEAARRSKRTTRRERRRQTRLRSLVADAAAADFTVTLTDEVPRIPDAAAAARRFRTLVRSADLGGFGVGDRLALGVGGRIAPLVPRLVMPVVVERLRREATGVILPAEDPAFTRHLEMRRRTGARCNVNLLGEAILGDGEAARRLDALVTRIRRPDVDYVSVKVSAICAGLGALAFDANVERIADRLRVVYREAARMSPPTFVNLDMEEYRDLDLTIAAFRTVLDEPEFERLDAGIVLQAYLPDSIDAARSVASWATQRHRRAGGRIRIRIVKGANLAMEQVEAELHGWEQAPHETKADVDAGFKAVLDLLLDQRHDDAVRIGLASHNLFDVAWALLCRDELRGSGRPDRLEIEMLEGMAPTQAGVVRDHTGDLLLYTPVVARADFAAAIAYLVRRLDENTTPDNFLTHLFDLAEDPARFEIEAEKFTVAVRARSTVSTARRRPANRPTGPSPPTLDEPFRNAVDTDWTHPDHRAWIADALAAARSPTARAGPPPTVSAPTVDSVEHAIATAVRAVPDWSSRSPLERATIVDRIGTVVEQHRGRIIATMVGDASKTVAEADPEVSEAVDFARYDARCVLGWPGLVGARPGPIGPVVVTPPWNFPFAIPLGGVVASLAAGNPVILKPAPQVREVGALVAEMCWEAGVPTDVLQLVPADDDEAGRRLVTHPEVAAVLLTGAHETAQRFLDWRPDLHLQAETSGKNAMVVTASADVDRVVADLVRSAFGHGGQKCSAASLAIVAAPLYDDPAFLERIRDAAATLRIGPADDPATDVAPLIEPPGDRLERGLTTLDEGETWLLEPAPCSPDGRSWSPGIRLGVRPRSWFARTECFGPVLGIIRAADLDEAIRIQNDTDVGLTAGLQSLDPDEIAEWCERAEAGNLYVNRGMTGAIVQRQPFGGWKRSSVGPTAKPGGPNFVATLARWHDTGRPLDEVERKFEEWMRSTGSVEHDPTGLAAERNVFRYRPLPGGVAVRCGPATTDRQRALIATAGRATGARIEWSDTNTESAAAFADRLQRLGVDRLRLLGADDDRTDHAVRRAAHGADVAVDDAEPVGAAAVELPRWLREQAISTTMHRHGRITRTDR